MGSLVNLKFTLPVGKEFENWKTDIPVLAVSLQSIFLQTGYILTQICDVYFAILHITKLIFRPYLSKQAVSLQKIRRDSVKIQPKLMYKVELTENWLFVKMLTKYSGEYWQYPGI